MDPEVDKEAGDKAVAAAPPADAAVGTGAHTA